MLSSERKRKRPAVSCTLCRRRKIRCNRETPCSNCVRSRNTACMYEAEVANANMGHARLPLQHAKNGDIRTDTASAVGTAFAAPSSAPTPLLLTSSNSPSSFEFEAMKNRIVELEEKLSQVSSATTSVYTAASSPAPTHTVQTVTSFAGTIDVMQDSRAFGRTHAISRSIAHKNRVFGQSHWMNGFIVFRDIIEMVEPSLRDGSSNVVAEIQRAKVLARMIKSQRSPSWPTPSTRDLPPKHVCHQLVNGYLRTSETVYRVLHIPSFQRDYETLWVTGTEPSMAFMILLKLVLAIGATVHDENFSMRTEATRWVYEAQTWLSSPVFKSRLGVQYLQTSVLLLLAREVISVGSELVWISLGSVIRAAMYMGLHKDPAQLPRMTMLEAEMRRRIWNTILEVSLQTSLESGGPTLISLEDFDTDPPGNFNDDQLMANKPTAKPDSVYTQSSTAVALRKTLPARLAVVTFLNSISSTGTYEETLRIDTAFRAAYKTLRHAFAGFTANEGLSPSSFALQAIDFIMQRYITSLHVPFFGPSLDEPVYAFSRKAVVDSSLKVWTLACPPSVPAAAQTPVISTRNSYDTSSEGDLARLCRCGAGFFRTFAFHASTFLGIEVRAQIQDEDDISSVPLHSNLHSVLDDASSWYLRCMEAGETGVKGYLLLKLLTAQVDATKRRIHHSELPILLVKAAEEAAETCLPLLEAMAGQEQAIDGDGTSDGFDFQVAPDFMEDWDLVMSDILNFGDNGTFDTF